MDLPFYGAFPVYWQLNVLYYTCHIHLFTRSFMYWQQMADLLFRRNLEFSILLKDTDI